MRNSFLGAPAVRFRQIRLLIIGCGDVGLRVAKLAPKHLSLMALTSQAERMTELRAKHIKPLLGDLDDAKTLARLSSIANRILHLAPPPIKDDRDSRTKNLIQVLRRRSKPSALVYASTTGVYGNCDSAWVDETRTVNPQTDRAKRRVDAETTLRRFGSQSNVRVNSLRIPGIYAADRAGADPLDRIRQGVPSLMAKDDVYSNHIHADSLAKACLAALWHGKPQRNYNVAENSGQKTGDYYDALADAAGLPRPPRITRAEAEATFSPMRLSFLSESRRIDNERMKNELGISLNRINKTT